MKFADFLAELSRIEAPQSLYIPSFQENGTHSARQRVIVGWGDWNQVEDTAPGLLLTNKGTARHFGLERDYTSVTRFVFQPPEGYLENWSLWGLRPVGPANALGNFTIVADDASPDSVMAVFLLLARMADVDLSEVPPVWLEAVDHWEQTGSAHNIWHSWCALESALVHRIFPRETLVRSGSFGLGWRDALRFLAKSIALGLDPVNVPECSGMEEYAQARAALEQEQELYWDWLQRATQLQVSLPLSGPCSRRMLVDGILVEAQQITGATKVFLRNDREHSPLGRGFSFLALCAPPCLGYGADIVISVDPKRGVSLLSLWEAIENRENLEWNDDTGLRPTDTPRVMEGVNNIYQQPWYIDPTQTLIASPRKLADGQPGSRLDWQAIRETIWQGLNPLHGVVVLECQSGKEVPLLDIRPEPVRAEHPMCFIAAKWMDGRADDSLLLPPALSESFFLFRVLAAKLRKGRSTKPLCLGDLPPNGSWDLVKLNGGVAIVSHDGVFVLDDWTGEPLLIAEIREGFHEAATLDQQLSVMETRNLRELVDAVRDLTKKNHRVSDVERLLPLAASLSIRLTEVRGRYAMLPKDPNARLIRKAIDKRWSLDHRLNACEREIQAIEASLRNLSELSTLAIGRFISIYGFALFLAVGAGPFVAKALFHVWRGAPEADASALFNLGCMGALALLLFAALRLWHSLARPMKRAAQKET